MRSAAILRLFVIVMFTSWSTARGRSAVQLERHLAITQALQGVDRTGLALIPLSHAFPILREHGNYDYFMIDWTRLVSNLLEIITQKLPWDSMLQGYMFASLNNSAFPFCT